MRRTKQIFPPHCLWMAMLACVFSVLLLSTSNAFAQAYPGAPGENATLVLTAPEGSEPEGEISGCATDTWTAMVNQAVAQTRRETVFNKRFIVKSDSVLQYSCFDNVIANTVATVDPIFTASDMWEDRSITVLGDDDVNINVYEKDSDAESGYFIDFLSQNTLEESLILVVDSALRNYINGQFNHPYLSGTTPVSGTGQESCVSMSAIWQAAKCVNFSGSTPFPTFAEMAAADFEDPRQFPSGDNWECVFPPPPENPPEPEPYPYVDYVPPSYTYTPSDAPLYDPLAPFTPTDSCGVIAFPGAQGYGAGTVGGRGGQVITVSNLNDSGPGSLREALENVNGPRTIIFNVQGEIKLRDEIKITSPYVTLAGQSAPGAGVVISGARLKIETNDVIVRGMKIRPGDDPGGDDGRNRDAISIGNGGRNVIIDSNSLTWAVDETVGIWGATSNITVSNNLIAEALYNSIHVDEGKTQPAPHSTGLIIGNKEGEPNNQNISVIGNLFASINSRAPLVKKTYSTEIINNYVSNHGLGHQATALGGGNSPLEVALIGNYYEDGRDSGNDPRPPVSLRNLDSGSIVYGSDNRVESNHNTPYHGKTQYLVNNPSFTLSGSTILPAGSVKNNALSSVGARVNGQLDAIDQRIINEVAAGTTRIIDSQREVGGLNSINFTNERNTDSDRDGVPDDFEIAAGWDPNTPDANSDSDNDGIPNIEEWLNGRLSGVYDLNGRAGCDGNEEEEEGGVVEAGP